MKNALAMLLVAGAAFAAAPPTVPDVVFTPRPRYFAATAYKVAGDTTNESVYSNIVCCTNTYPVQINFDAPPGDDFDGFKLYTWKLTNWVKVFDLGTNTSWLLLAPTSPPVPPFNLVISNAAMSWTITNHTEPQRFWQAVLQTSTNLNQWETFSGIPLTLTKQ